MSKLVEYLTMTCSGTGQSTFYNTKAEQEKVLSDSHSEMLVEDRRLYALSVALPITDKSRQLILNNLLKTGVSCEDPELEGHVMSMAVEDLPFNRVLNMFMELRNSKVNNSRTRRLGRLIWNMVDDFRAVKYRNKIRTLLRHCRISEGSDPQKAEIHRWIFGVNNKRGRAKLKATDIKYNPKIKSRILATTKYDELFNLPYDIARDIAVNVHGKNPKEFERQFVGKDGKKGKGNASRKETMRARQKTSDTTVDFSRFSIFELLMHAYRNEADKAEILPFANQKAREIADGLNLPEKVALVVDNSVSSLGSAERLFQPLAMITAITKACEFSDSDVQTFFVGPEPVDGYLRANGPSNLRKPVVDALLTRPDLVLILSDGYENVRAGSVNQILHTKAVIDSGISVMHLNPVAAIESNAKARVLSDRAMAFGVASPEQLPMVTLVALAAQDPILLEPMFESVESNLKLGDYKAAKLATRLSGMPALT